MPLKLNQPTNQPTNQISFGREKKCETKLHPVVRLQFYSSGYTFISISPRSPLNLSESLQLR